MGLTTLRLEDWLLATLHDGSHNKHSARPACLSVQACPRSMAFGWLKDSACCILSKFLSLALDCLCCCICHNLKSAETSSNVAGRTCYTDIVAPVPWFVVTTTPAECSCPSEMHAWLLWPQSLLNACLPSGQTSFTAMTGPQPQCVMATRALANLCSPSTTSTLGLT